jgi:hypothetical protein
MLPVVELSRKAITSQLLEQAPAPYLTPPVLYNKSPSRHILDATLPSKQRPLEITLLGCIIKTHAWGYGSGDSRKFARNAGDRIMDPERRDRSRRGSLPEEPFRLKAGIIVCSSIYPYLPTLAT